MLMEWTLYLERNQKNIPDYLIKSAKYCPHCGERIDKWK